MAQAHSATSAQVSAEPETDRDQVTEHALSEDGDSESDIEEPLLDTIYDILEECDTYPASYEEFFNLCWWDVGIDSGVTEEQFRDYWFYFFSQDSVLYDRERSYLDGVRGARTGARLDYDMCTPQELKRFVNERGLGDPYPEGVTLKRFYVPLLVRADRESKFRFMDLPPEMRLLIYKDILVFPDGSNRKRCDTAILRTSHAINEEANEMLYDGNIITCEFRCTEDESGVFIRSAKVHNDFVHGKCCHGNYGRLPEGIDDYPEFLRRISHLRIVIEGEVYDSDGVVNHDCFYALNHYLYTLASFLMDGHRLKEVQIDAELDDLEDSGEVWGNEFIFWPLRRLRNVKEVIVNDVPHKYKKKIVEDLTSSEPVFNTLRQWKLLHDRARAQLDLLKATYTMKDCTCGTYHTTDHMDMILGCLAVIEDKKLECCVNSVEEERFIARLAKLRDVLSFVQVDELEDLVKVLKAKHGVWEEHEAVTDGGRLDEAAGIWEGMMDDEEAALAEDHDWSDDESMDGVEPTFTAEVTEKDNHDGWKPGQVPAKAPISSPEL